MLRKQVKQFLPWAWLLFCFLVLMLFLHRNLSDLLDSDMASELLLAKVMIDTGKLLPTEWYYSTEIRILNMQLFFAPFFLITDNWHFVRLLGTATGLVCMLISFYFLCKQLNLNKWFPLIAAPLLFPFSEQYSYIILIGTQYLPYAIISFTTLGAMIKHTHTTKKAAGGLLAVTVLLAFGVGITGLRMILLLYLPAFMCALILFFHPALAETHLQIKRFFCNSGLCLVSSGLGYLINSKVLSRFYHFMQFEDMKFTAFDPNRIIDLLNDWLTFLSYPANGSVFSLNLCNALLCAISLFLILMAAYTCLRRLGRIELTVESRIPILTYACGMLLYAILLSVSDAPYSIYYLVPAGILTPITIAVILQNCQWTRRACSAVVCTIMLLLSVCGFQNYAMYSKHQLNDEIQTITESLVKDGYRNGYATFWNGNIVTELSSGQIDMRVWPYDETMDITSIYRWLQLKSHETTEPEGKTFILFSKWYNEQNDRMLGRWLNPEDKYWESNDFLVYGYENYQDLLDSVHQHYTAYYSNGQWKYGASDQAANSILAGGVSVSLPDIPLYPGSYTIILTGQGLEQLNVRCLHEQGELSPAIQTVASDTLVLQLETNDLLHSLNIRFENTGDTAIVLGMFELEKITTK